MGRKKGYIHEEGVKKKIKKSLKGRHVSPYTEFKKGKEHPQYKGARAFAKIVKNYYPLHNWIKSRKPKSMFCEKCGKITDKLDCSNISGKYLKDISDWRWLCRSCHKSYDLNKLDGRLK